MVQRLRFLIAPVLLAGALAACGGGGGATDGVATLSNSESGEATVTTLSSGDTEKALLEWVTCMRGEGVDVPDPTVDADGNLTLRPGNQGGERSGDQQAGPPDRDSLQAATTTCGNPPEGALGFNEEDRQSFQESALKLSQCMRDQGITDFPDPDFSNFGPGAGPSCRCGVRICSSTTGGSRAWLMRSQRRRHLLIALICCVRS